MVPPGADGQSQGSNHEAIRGPTDRIPSPPLIPYPYRVVRIVVKDPEEFEQALREFRRKVQEQGLVREMRRRSHYVPPAEARKIKSLRARRRRTR